MKIFILTDLIIHVVVRYSYTRKLKLVKQQREGLITIEQ